MIHLDTTIPGKPVPQARMRHGGGHGYYSKPSREYRELLVMAIRAAWGPRPALDGRVRLSVEVAGARANSDLSNHIKQIEDAVVSAGVLKDDCIKYLRGVSARAVPGDAGVRVVIEDDEQPVE